VRPSFPNLNRPLPHLWGQTTPPVDVCIGLLPSVRP
jgi:hypothetical protein